MVMHVCFSVYVCVCVCVWVRGGIGKDEGEIARLKWLGDVMLSLAVTYHVDPSLILNNSLTSDPVIQTSDMEVDFKVRIKETQSHFSPQLHGILGIFTNAAGKDNSSNTTLQTWHKSCGLPMIYSWVTVCCSAAGCFLQWVEPHGTAIPFKGLHAAMWNRSHVHPGHLPVLSQLLCLRLPHSWAPPDQCYRQHGVWMVWWGLGGFGGCRDHLGLFILACFL